MSNVLVAETDLAVMFAGSTWLTPLYVLYQDAFHFAGTTLTAIYATYAVGNVAALFLFGHISDRVGRKRVALLATAIASAATLVFLLASGTSWLFAGRALSGLAIGMAASSATAWLADARAARDRPRAAVGATTANFCGLALGALVAGLLAQYAPAPLRLSHVVYLLALFALAVLVARARDAHASTVAAHRERSRRFHVSLPSGVRGAFFAPAANAFATFALVGFYAALTPTLLRDDLRVANLAAAAAVVGALFAVAAATAYATAAVPSRASMLASLAAVLPSVGLLAIAHALQSVPLLVAGVVITGVAAALGYRGSLQVVNELAPAARRAEVLSAYQIVCFIGNALPVVGVGLLAARFGAAAATTVFATALAALAATALALDFARGRASGERAQRPRSPPARTRSAASSGRGGRTRPSATRESL